MGRPLERLGELFAVATIVLGYLSVFSQPQDPKEPNVLDEKLYYFTFGFAVLNVVWGFMRFSEEGFRPQ